MRRLIAAVEARLRDLPLRRKLVAVITATSAVALIVASGALIALDVQRFRADVRDDLEAMAHILGDTASAALPFDDRESADELLNALAAKPQIVAAAVYDAAGRQAGAYRRDDRAEPLPAAPGPDGLRETQDLFEVVGPVALRGRRVGSILVRGSLEGLSGRVRTRMTTVGLVLLAAWLLTLLLSAWLQRLVSDPLLRLAATARQVSLRQDYGLRATPHGRDEIGVLVTAFNDMLSQIERRDAELLAATGQLEYRVAERTDQLRRELSVRRRAEEELERRNAELVSTNRELDDFAYIASHDLKEPLRGIHNYARFLVEDYGPRFDAAGRAKLDTLVRLSLRMELLIDSLLRYSRLGRTDLAVEPVDAQDVVDEVLDRLAITLREHEVDVRLPARLPVIEADRVHLGEAFANLVTNAVKYNDKPLRWIEIGTREVEWADGDRTRPGVAFYVRDNGIGIQARHLDGVFRIFKRLHARDEFGGGTGAGLTIVRKIVERHHGRIWIVSSPGEGTTVFFTLQKGA
jgi:signal transduction histidine kinase